MAYASFRCLVDAPFAEIWRQLHESIQINPVQRSGASAVAIYKDPNFPERCQLRISNQDYIETVSIHPELGEIIFRLEHGQSLSGERRFSVRSDRSSSRMMIESSLDWRSQIEGQDPNLDAALDVLVREPVLAIKSRLKV